MQLINILLIAISVLTFLSGAAVLAGSIKSERSQGIWFFLAAVGEVFWAVSISLFLSLSTGENSLALAPWLIKGIYVGAILMDSCILGYVSWKYSFGKILTILFLSFGAILSIIFLYDPSVLYAGISITNEGNRLLINTGGWFYTAYIAFFCTLVPAFCLSLIYRIKHTPVSKGKSGFKIFLIGLAAAGGLSLIFDLIMPLYRYDLIWVGPLAIGLTIMTFYYAILRYRILSLSTNVLKILSYIILLCSGVIIYLLIFFLVFSALFPVSTPSTQVFLLNFFMVAIVICLLPAISELSGFMNSLISTRKMSIAYIVKKIERLDGQKVDLRELATFLAEHMHFSYIGIIVNGRLYSSRQIDLSADDISKVTKLKNPSNGIWQDVNGEIESVLNNEGVTGVAQLYNSKGKPFGQVLIGKNLAKGELNQRDLIQVEMIINLSATVIEDGK